MFQKLRWILSTMWVLVLSGIIAEPVSVGIFGYDPAAEALQQGHSLADWLPWTMTPDYVQSDQWVKPAARSTARTDVHLHPAASQPTLENLAPSHNTTAILEQLKRWNAEYLLLERRPDDTQKYRFLCVISAENAGASPVRFETFAESEETAMREIYDQVRTWRERDRRIFQARPVTAAALTTLR